MYAKRLKSTEGGWRVHLSSCSSTAGWPLLDVTGWGWGWGWQLCLVHPLAYLCFPSFTHLVIYTSLRLFLLHLVYFHLYFPPSTCLLVHDVHVHFHFSISVHLHFHSCTLHSSILPAVYTSRCLHFIYSSHPAHFFRLHCPLCTLHHLHFSSCTHLSTFSYTSFSIHFHVYTSFNLHFIHLHFSSCTLPSSTFPCLHFPLSTLHPPTLLFLYTSIIYSSLSTLPFIYTSSTYTSLPVHFHHLHFLCLHFPLSTLYPPTLLFMYTSIIYSSLSTLPFIYTLSTYTSLHVHFHHLLFLVYTSLYLHFIHLHFSSCTLPSSTLPCLHFPLSTLHPPTLLFLYTSIIYTSFVNTSSSSIYTLLHISSVIN